MSYQTDLQNKIPQNNFLSDPNLLQPETLLNSWKEKKNKKFKFNFTILQKLCRSCRGNSLKKLIYYQIENKMSKVISFENFVKVTRDLKILNHVLLDSHYKNILKDCLIPRKPKATDLLNLEIIIDDIRRDDKMFKKVYQLVSL
jgi:hypothetical protein